MYFDSLETNVLTFWDKFKLNLSHWYQRATYIVLGLWGVGLAVWNTMMTDADHQAVYALVPYGLGKFAPFVAFAITYVAANGWPQPALQAKITAKKEEVVQAKLDGPDA